jgi:hypothetical protein
MVFERAPPISDGPFTWTLGLELEVTCSYCFILECGDSALITDVIHCFETLVVV